MKLQIENNSSSDFKDISSDVSSANGSAEVTEILRKGIKSAQDGNRAEARHLLMQVTELEPKNENAWLWLASISEYPEELLIFLSNVLSINSKNERALEWEKSTKSLLSKTFVQRGIEASKESQSGFARQSFLQAIVHDDKNEMAWLWLASISDIVEEKKSHLQKVLNINPNNETALASLKAVKTEMAHGLLKKAQTEALSGEYESAGKLLGDIINYVPNLEDAWMLKCFLSDSFSEKIKHFEKILEINPNNETAVSCLAAMKSVKEKTEPKPDSDKVGNFDLAEKATDKNKVAEDVLELNALEEREVLELEQKDVVEPQEMFAAPKNDEDVSYTTDEIADFPTQDYKFSDNLMQQFKAVEESENNSTPQVESVAEIVEMNPEVSEDLKDDDQEMNMAFSEAQESVFEEIQHKAESIKTPTEEVHSVSAMPSYHEVIEEELFEEVQKEEETVKEFEYVDETTDNQPVFEQQIYEESPVSSENYNSNPVSSNQEINPQPEHVEEPTEVKERFAEKPKAEMVLCAFCKTENEPQNFICRSCRAMLTISDVEMLLGYEEVNTAMVQQAVEKMEIAHSIKNFDAQGLKMLGIGLLNLKNLRKGFEYLQESAYLTPNDVLLNSQVNSLAIRLSEIEEHQKNHNSMPKNKTILVVDDSATVRKLISGKLEKSGLEVVCAIDGMDALEKINENIPDLILLDITMPRMDGYQVCKLIRGNEATKDVPVVMISGKDGFFDKVRGRMAGTTGYITKPFGPETLMKTVEAYID